MFSLKLFALLIYAKNITSGSWFHSEKTMEFQNLFPFSMGWIKILGDCLLLSCLRFSEGGVLGSSFPQKLLLVLWKLHL